MFLLFKTYARPLAALRLQAQHLWALSVLAQAPCWTFSAQPPRTKRASKNKTQPPLPLCCALSPDLSRCSSSSASVPPLYGLRREGALHDVAAKSRDIFLVVRSLGSLPNCSKRKHTDGCRTNSECHGASSDDVEKSTRRGSGTHAADMGQGNWKEDPCVACHASSLLRRLLRSAFH